MSLPPDFPDATPENAGTPDTPEQSGHVQPDAFFLHEAPPPAYALAPKKRRQISYNRIPYSRKNLLITVLVCAAILVVVVPVIVLKQVSAVSPVVSVGKTFSPQKVLALSTSTPTLHTPTPLPSTSHTQAVPTPTASPATLLSQGSFTVPSKWTQKINDPLTVNSPWAVDDLNCKLVSNGYVVTSKGPNYCNYDAPAHDFPDLAYSIDITLHQGYMGGLVFRLVNDNYYGFYITTQGTYQILWHTSADNGNDTSIDPANSPIDTFKTSSVLYRGLGRKNNLSVLAQGTSLQFWINGQKVASLQDRTYRTGNIGVFVGDPANQTATSATFTNAQVWTP